MKLKNPKTKNTMRGREPSALPHRTSGYTYRAHRLESGSLARQSVEHLDAKPKETVGILRNLPTYLAGLVIVFCAVWVLLLNTKANINFRVSGGSNLARSIMSSKQDYQAQAEQILSASLSSRSKLTFDSVKIVRQMVAAFPELGQVEISLPLIGHRPIFYLTSVEPALILVANGGQELVVDSRGVVVAANRGQFDATLPVVNDQSGIAAKLGQQALAANDVSFIEEVAAQLKAKNISVESFSLPIASRQADVHLGGRQFYAKFNLEGEARLQSGALLAVLGRLDASGIAPKEYIDVRLAERVFYK